MKDQTALTKALALLAEVIAPRLQSLIQSERERHQRNMQPFDSRREYMREQHDRERMAMMEGQRQRADAERIARSERLRGGLRGRWDRLSGERAPA